MLRHILTVAIRNFSRHRSSFLINLIGLSTGLACAMLIFLWIYDEYQVDAFFENEDRLFQVMEHQQYADEIMSTLSTPGLLAESLAEEIPEIAYGATMFWGTTYTLTVGDLNLRKEGRYVGPDFLQIFSFPLLEGKRKDVLKELNGIVLSRSTADALFGSYQEAMGKTLELDHEDPFLVTGIFEDVPQGLFPYSLISY